MLFPSFFITIVILAFLPGYSSSCSENEIEAECVSACNTCEQRGPCPPPPACQQGCDCKSGFFRDENGYCVPEQQCLGRTENPKCPKNALFLSCCPLVLPTCENPDPEPDSDDECVPGCVCSPGFLKQRDGQCVIPDQCYPREDHGKESTCREGEEYYDCTPSCKNTCENFNKAGEKCPCGPPGCFCKEGLVKRSDGECVPPGQCPPSPNDPSPKCPNNAIFIECGSPCPPTCEDLQPKPCEEKCTTACYCKPGYLKRKDGVCVRPTDCQPPKKRERPEPKCPENAIFIQCGSPCPPTCENRLPEACEEKCTTACYCKPGYLLDTKKGKCVKPELCTTSRIPAGCPENETASDCVVPCNDCKIKGNCQFFACNKGCDCKKGYHRNKDGKCIPASECPKMIPPRRECDVNEKFYNCTPSCKNTCKNFFNPGVKCEGGPPGCFCKEGLVKRADGKCIPPSQCHVTKPPSCPKNSEFSACGPSCRLTCSDPYPKPCAGTCVKGCFCKPGFVQEKNGRCVRLENCSRKCFRPDEEFLECGSTCPDTCENRGRPRPGSCPYRCIRGCFCRKGLYRTKRGYCVPLKDCYKEDFTTAKPTTTRKYTVIVPDDCHGCPRRAECENYCKSLGDFVGFCTGEGHRQCRCA